MNILRLSALLGAVTSLSTTCAVFAQNEIPVLREVAPPQVKPASAQLDTTTWHVIQLRNSLPSSLAHKIDPEHNKAPAWEWIKTARASDAVELPGTIERIVPFDAQGLLLIKGGSEQDAREFKTLVDELDKRPISIEVNLTFMEIKAEDARQLDIKYAENSPNAVLDSTVIEPRIGFFSGNVQEKLNALTLQGKAKFIGGPRSTSPDNSEGSVESSSTTSPVNSSKKSTSEHLKVTTKRFINEDGSIMLNMEIFGNEGVKEHGVANFSSIREGENIVLTGLSPLFAQPTDKAAPRNVIAFLTARIVPESELAKPAN